MSGVKALLQGPPYRSHPVQRGKRGDAALTVGGGRLKVKGQCSFLRFQSLLGAEGRRVTVGSSSLVRMVVSLCSTVMLPQLNTKNGSIYILW